MALKGVKPRTNLLFDCILFVLLVTLTVSAFISHYILQEGTHLQFHFHALHEVSGIAMCVAVGLHLLFHLPWIQAQLSRSLKRKP